MEAGRRTRGPAVEAGSWGAVWAGAGVEAGGSGPKGRQPVVGVEARLGSLRAWLISCGGG